MRNVVSLSGLGLTVALSFAGACAKPQETPRAPESAVPAAAPAAPQASVAPVSAHGSTVSADTATGTVPAPAAAAGASGLGAIVETDTVRFELPASWQRSTPSSSLRLAQAAIPGAGGAGELAVFHFGPGQGGTVDANFERWLGQVEAAAGAAPERGNFEANGFAVSWIDARGTLLPSTMGMGPTTPQPNSRLVGAVVEGEGGPWFFKVTGPAATIDAEREAFLNMLRAFRKK